MRISSVTQAYSNELRRGDSNKKTVDKDAKVRAGAAAKPEISSNAQRLSDTEAAASTVKAQVVNTPDVRADKIAEVREKIENGFYNSPEFEDKLAEKLIKDFGLQGNS